MRNNNNNNNNNNKKAGKKKIQTLKVSQMTVSNGKLHSVSSVLAPSEMHSSILS